MKTVDMSTQPRCAQYEYFRTLANPYLSLTANCDITLAVVCFAKIMLVDHLLLNNDSVTTLVALVVCITMALTVLVAKLIGCSLPMLAKKIGFDPAVMASPFITTIVDALSLLVYFGIASAMLSTPV